MTELLKIEGIGEKYADKFKTIMVTTVEELLEKGATPKGRDEMSETTGISGHLILKWVNHADLFRIKGIGEEYADLLEASGVDTVPELAQRSPENLHARLIQENDKRKLVRQVPGLSQVKSWVEQAQNLPRVISY